MRYDDSTANAPINHHFLPGLKCWNAPIVSHLLPLPSENSASITGIPNSSIHMIYNRRNAEPPLLCVSAGKRQMLPRPTADPTVAAIRPNFDANSDLVDIGCWFYVGLLCSFFKDV